MVKVSINTDLIYEWSSFHKLFAKIFGFPDFYGNSMNAWIDCMSDIDDPETGMTKIHIGKNETLVIELKNARLLKKRSFEIYLAILEAVAYINERKLVENEGAMIAIAID